MCVLEVETIPKERDIVTKAEVPKRCSFGGEGHFALSILKALTGTALTNLVVKRGIKQRIS